MNGWIGRNGKVLKKYLQTQRVRPMLVVVSVPLTVKKKGFEVEVDSPERVKVLVVGMVG